MERFGKIAGRDVFRAHLKDADTHVSVLSYGAIVQDWRARGADGTVRSVTLGYDEPEPYALNRGSFGIVAGRVANRIRHAAFTLDGETISVDRNHGAHHLHGGTEGLGRQHFDMEVSGRSVRLAHTSPHGHMGYPGSVAFTITITLLENSVTFEMLGAPDRPTPIALAQHSYYRLGRPADEHSLAIAAENTTVLNAEKVPTGDIAPIAGTALDFRTPRRIGSTRLDNNFCLTGAMPAATLSTDLYRLTLATDRPGLQVFNAHDLPTLPTPGHDGLTHGPFAGIALEAQDLPDAVNHPHFGNIIATPANPYRQSTTVTIDPAGR